MEEEEIRRKIKSFATHHSQDIVSRDGTVIPADPQCWKCDSLEVSTSKVYNELHRTCLSCGTTWVDKMTVEKAGEF